MAEVEIYGVKVKFNGAGTLTVKVKDQTKILKGS